MGSDAETVFKADEAVGHLLTLRKASAAVMHGGDAGFDGDEGGGDIRRLGGE